MSITGLELISSVPRKNGKISVLLEINRTKENIRALVELYGDNKLTLLSAEELGVLPQDRFFLLLDIRARCQQVQDMITAELEPLPAQTDVTTKLDVLLDRLTAPDEFEATHPVEEELTSEVLLAASMYVPPGPYARDPIVAADEFDRKDHIEFSKGIPENDLYGEEEDKT